MTSSNNQRNTPEPDDWLSVTDVMELLSISRRTVYRYVELGYLPKRVLPGKLIRFARSDVMALLREPKEASA